MPLHDRVAGGGEADAGDGASEVEDVESVSAGGALEVASDDFNERDPDGGDAGEDEFPNMVTVLEDTLGKGLADPVAAIHDAVLSPDGEVATTFGSGWI